MPEKKTPVLGQKTETEEVKVPAVMVSENEANDFPLQDTASSQPAAQEDQYVEFEAEVVNKEDDYVDIKYSRNNSQGELDTSHFAISRFGVQDVKSFDEVKKGDAKISIAHAALTEALLKYEDNKQAVE